MEDLARLGKVVRDRRLQLGLTQQQAAVEARVSDTTWLSVEQGQRRASALTLAGVARALQWSAESPELVLAGGNPMTVLPDDERALAERERLLESVLGTPIAKTRHRYDDVLEDLGEIIEHLSLGSLESLLDAARSIAADEGQARAESWIEDLMKEGMSFEEAVRSLNHDPHEGEDDLGDAALAAKGGRPDVVIEPPQPGDAPEDPG